MTNGCPVPVESDSVSMALPLRGDDAELAAIGAIIHLLERCEIKPAFGRLTDEQKERIAGYLYQRYQPAAKP